ncbi:MAG: class I tRNA ligase family protein, partial [Thermoproteota archaeon]
LDREDRQTLNVIRDRVKQIGREIEGSKLRSAANHMVSLSRIGNKYLNEKKPWKVVKNNREKAGDTVYVVVQIVKALAVVSSPFIPSVAQELWTKLCLSGKVSEESWTEALNPLPAGHKVSEAEPLFQKIEADRQELKERLKKIRKRS